VSWVPEAGAVKQGEVIGSEWTAGDGADGRSELGLSRGGDGGCSGMFDTFPGAVSMSR
jgi:hypothetical protein